jgi:pyruvate formate lyase activating enzyme
MHSGVVFNIQRYAVQDGPGIRTTVFFKGCPMHCAWCHNPESISPRREILILESRCIGCGECRSSCPQAKSDPGQGVLPPRNPACLFCGACVEACPTQARRMVGQEMTVAQVIEAVLQDRVFYDESGGGVTFSGGEPLAQPEFLGELLDACRARGLRTAVDTCGLVRPEALLAAAAMTDLFLYDLKLMDDDKHRHYTGASNSLILDNLRALGRAHQRIWVRVPILPGINDAPADLEATARFVAGIPSVRQVNLLPFHRTGLQKAKRLGQTSRMAQTQPPSEAAMNQAIEIFRNQGLVARAGG